MRFPKRFIRPYAASAGTASTLLLLFGASAVRAQNATLIFEPTFNTIYGGPVTLLGYEVRNPASQTQHFHFIDSTVFPSVPNNGTGVLLNDINTEIQITAASSSTFTTFTLNNVDVAANFFNPNDGVAPATGLTITGFLNNVQTGVVTLPFFVSGYTNLSGAPLGVVDRITFDGIGGGGGFVLDNVNLDPDPRVAVPEPRTYVAVSVWLSVAGVGLTRGRSRKRQSRDDASAVA